MSVSELRGVWTYSTRFMQSPLAAGEEHGHNAPRIDPGTAAVISVIREHDNHQQLQSPQSSRRRRRRRAKTMRNTTSKKSGYAVKSVPVHSRNANST